MKAKPLTAVFMSLALLAAPELTQAQSIAVENVRFSQQVDHRVVVTYDLLGDSKKRYNVILSLLNPTSRKKVPLSSKNLSGAVGKKVKPGKDLQIVWDLKKDYPDGLEGERFRFIIDAYWRKKTGARRFSWFLVGAAAGGGALLYYTTKNGIGGGADLPRPPVLPDN